MSKKMLIDATHAEETRVVVVDGNKVEEFDFESASRRQLAGNIYLAKVTRVEPSLQAAFVDYGGNRHGFLAFSEIHPDYYQIPIADREALLAEERALAEAEGDAEDAEDDARAAGRAVRGNGTSGRDGGRDGGRSDRRGRNGRPRGRPQTANGDAVTSADVASAEIAGMEMIDLGEGESESGGESGAESESGAEFVARSETGDAPGGAAPMLPVDDAVADSPADDGEDRGNLDVVEKDDTIETVAEEDDALDMRPRQKPRARRYKIQEVVKVRQIMLVQVVKEERGNKGAALTTYLSLAGRYCVLMPNTARGGGISRKITNAADRKKLKEIADELDVPQGAGLIIRTAGSQRTKAEIKRDYEYLQRLWEQIRELTLKSMAPAKIYEEGDLIKRSIRDLYSKDIDEVIVEGADGYRTAKDFMKMIMPSHAKSVQLHAETLPLFARYQVEGYLASMFNPTVQLPSGGYIVIGVTEALVAIDVNSGRATKEGSIEQTALKTNLEAADEVARQLRLRDLAGLIVIDFIDMDERKNNAAVEKRFKDRLKTDRARIQLGRISGFGLMEMSRQRLRPGMIEATTQPCPHCHGTGLLRSDNNVGLSILRQLEEEGVRGRSKEVLVRVPLGIMNFLMNHKREHIAGIEMRYGMAVRVEGDLTLISPDFAIEKFKTATRTVPEAPTAIMGGIAAMMTDEDDADLAGVEDEDDEEAEAEAEAETGAGVAGATAAVPAVARADDGQPRKKKRRRRRRRGAPGEAGAGVEANGSDEGADDDDDDDSEAAVTAPLAATEAAPRPKRTRSRSRRAPAANPAENPAGAEAAADGAPATDAADPGAGAMPDPVSGPVPDPVSAPDPEPVPQAAPAKRSRSRKAAAPAADAPAADAPAKAPRTRRARAAAAPPDAPVAEAAPAPQPAPEPQPEPEPQSAPQPEPAAAPVAVAITPETVADPATPVVEPVADAAPDPDRPRRRGWWSGRG